MADDAPLPDDPHAVPDWLLGRWRLLRAESALDFAPGVCMDFRRGGRLLYSFSVEGHAQTVPLIYQVEGDVLRTDNPAGAERVVRLDRVRGGGVLVLDFSGARAWFVKEEG